ncbi:ATP synthase F0 subunit C [candidate division KSB1 bacterium]|nr:ATP synthase F0 subunit C [candidate division KSB1 bacterium]NIR72741.1 ATP synthase F0 subunit C [candidate division KSB1 bacterium]NIS26829.1 ATP synthase F0 subunit C [candidate division KSB1 bacterium]NIT73623.1 ATP synthase F0 subunit C [candidate division KSB1 bacterium]NIU27496.1 ATP synthase F0 subunit C [candidate division KSB1 bacterium]
MTDLAYAFLAAGFGAAISVIGGAFGVSKCASSAVEGIARQPDAAGDIRGAMIITAAMIEGVALLALVICFLLSLK